MVELEPWEGSGRGGDGVGDAQMEFNKMNRMRTTAGWVYVGIKRREPQETHG